MQKIYSSVIDYYAATWVEFVVHSEDLGDKEVLGRRNRAVRWLKETKGVRVSFAVPVEEGGVGEGVKWVLEDAKGGGLELDGECFFAVLILHLKLPPQINE